ncbi:MAG TPA: glycosyltransferase [Planctomicrobium sp.]|nr:glycosyltransferase [Planctomicrobium sp.]
MAAEVCVLLPVKQTPSDWFRMALESLLRQTVELEILVLDASESDAISQSVYDFADARIRQITMPKSVSLTEQLNHGLQICRSEFVARADADDLNEPQRLSRQLETFRNDGDLDVLGTGLTIIDSNGNVVGPRRYPETHDAIAATTPYYNPLAHPTVMFRRSAVLSVGGYGFSGRPCQDYDLWSRLLLAGYRFANLSSCEVRYRLHSSSVKSRHVHESLQCTLAIKKMYWRREMTMGAKCRYWIERLLTGLPADQVIWLQQRWQYGQCPKV